MIWGYNSNRNEQLHNSGLSGQHRHGIRTCGGSQCEEIARRIKAKYKNIDFRVVIKHASEWEDYLQQIGRIYGFLRKSNPIVYTFDGKIIGGREQFIAAATKYFGLDEEQLIVQDLTSRVLPFLSRSIVNQPRKKFIRRASKNPASRPCPKKSNSSTRTFWQRES